MIRGTKFQLIKDWKQLDYRHQKAINLDHQVLMEKYEERKREAQKQYDEIMENCPMEFKGYTAEKYEWDKQNIRDYYTKWLREDIFLTKQSLKRCRQWERKHNLRPFEEIDAEEKYNEEMIRTQQKEEEYGRSERLELRSGS